MTDTINIIRQVFEKDMGESVCDIKKFEHVENNTVYKIETSSRPYIFKIYNNPDWPEDGKLLFVDRLLTEHGIPHAKIFIYCRDNANFPNGYLIEECLPGATADRLKLSREETTAMFEKLGTLVSRLHKIKMDGYGYTGKGTALWSTFSEFMYDSMGDSKANLLAQKITDDDELEYIGQQIWERLKVCDKYPAVLCHTDLSTKNIIYNDGDITLIDWDDVYSLCWMHDLAEFTFWLKREYGDESEIYRHAFLQNTDYDLSDFYAIEPVLHVRIGLGSLNYFFDKPQSGTIKRMLQEAIENSGILTLRLSFERTV